ncbi:hypothetical protein MPER_03828, partial [Moniliophthora perniciosa FA553]
FAKYFGSGVIIATAFIHLLAPALEALGSECLAPAWSDYPYALALCMLSIFLLFIIELIAFRWGTAKLASLGTHYDAHGHDVGGHAAHGPEGEAQVKDDKSEETGTRFDVESVKARNVLDHPLTQIIGIAIFKFGSRTP